jgi:hypothetical protein
MKKENIMKERPIIMSGESVRAILDGRKSMTRRVVKVQPPSIFKHVCGNDSKNRMLNSKGERVFLFLDQPDMGYPFSEVFGTQRFPDDAFKCPYGQVGDRLWVRESWGVVSHAFDENERLCDWIPDRPALPIHDMKFGKGYYNGHIIYEADGDFEWNAGDDASIETKSCWKSSMHIPREASRITLEITDIRVERLQDISNEDAMAEGVEFASGWEEECGEVYCTGEGWMDYKSLDFGCGTPKESYITLWNTLNAKRDYPWESNPWVWVVSFKVVEK